MTTEPDHNEPSLPLLLGLTLMVGLAMLAIQLTAPPNLIQNNEDRMAAYTQDILDNGHWIVQWDSAGHISSKPPLYASIAALTAKCLGEINRIALYMPSILSTLAIACTILVVGRARLGWRAGLLASLVYQLSHVSGNGMVTARYDVLMSLTTTLAALAAFAAWQRGSGWTLFWAASAAGTLTKGPIALVLPAAGLLAAWWEKRTVGPAPIRGSHRSGIALFLVIVGGWLALAYWMTGREVIDKMILSELFTHAVSTDDIASPMSRFYGPALVFLAGFAPWSLFTCMCLWRICKNPAADPQQRRFERFLWCWFVVDLLIFSFAAHQRTRLIRPLVPSAALLAGMALARLTAPWRTAVMARVAAGTTLAGLLVFTAHAHGLNRSSFAVSQTEGLRQLALQVPERVGASFPLTQIETPFVFQFYSQARMPLSSLRQAARLAQGDAPFFCALRNIKSLKKQAGVDITRLHVLARWPPEGRPTLQIVSNHPRLEWTGRMAFGTGPFLITIAGLRLDHARGGEFVFSSLTGKGSLEFSNDSDRDRQVRVRLIGPGSEVVHDRLLARGETWAIREEEPQSPRQKR